MLMQLNHNRARAFVATVFIQLSRQKEVMRVLVVILIWSAGAEWTNAYKNAENVKVLEIALNECMRRGREIENVHQNCEKFDLDAYENIPSAYFDICRASFDVACFETLEESECFKGEAAARQGEKCDGNESDTFKKCCKACEFGAELKSTTGKCEISLRLSSDVLVNVTMRCCEVEGRDVFRDLDEFDSYARESLEEEAIESINLTPESLIAVPRKVSRCLGHQCENNEECFDSDEGPMCLCKPGFRKDFAGDCRDENECVLGLDNCLAENKNCVNTQGSFECGECLNGYKKIRNYFDDDGDGFSCVDDNECLNDVCGRNEICTNIVGSYRCSKVSCPPNYVSFNETDCKLKICPSRICHKTYSFVFKSVSANDQTNEVYRFPKTKFEATFDPDYFEIIDKANDYVVRQKQKLPHDMKVKLLIKSGRFQHMKNINIFLSQF